MLPIIDKIWWGFMKKLILLSLLLCPFANASETDCARINKDIEMNVKQIAAYEALGVAYAIKTGNMSYMSRNKPQIEEFKAENNALMQQASSLKCKPYSGDITGKSYKNFAKACANAEEDDSAKDELCNYDSWK